MTFHRAFGLSLLVAAVMAVGVLLVVVAPRWYAAAPPLPPAQPSAVVERKIKATLFYVSEDGQKLVQIQREIPYGAGVTEQAKRIVEAEIATPPAPLASAIPAGTRLRALYVSGRGNAYVDLSGEVVTAHPGGSLNERLTIYALVDALTANLPAITSVQILVDGREVDALAGHFDLRRPLGPKMKSLAPQEP